MEKRNGGKTEEEWRRNGEEMTNEWRRNGEETANKGRKHRRGVEKTAVEFDEKSDGKIDGKIDGRPQRRFLRDISDVSDVFEGMFQT